MIEVGKEPPPMLTDEERERKARKPSQAKGPAKGRFREINTLYSHGGRT